MDELMASPDKPLKQETRTYMLTKMHQGLAAIESDAEPTKNDWRCLSDVANVTESLIELGYLADPDDLLGDAIKALAEAGTRNLNGKVIRFDGPGIVAVRSLLECYAEAVGALPARAMVRAHRHCEKRIHEILAGKGRAKDVTLVDL
jgi:hypothetical protein